MKTINRLMIAAFAVLLFPFTVTAQEEPTYYITTTTFHWNMDKDDFKMSDWLAAEKEYFDKVTMKNQYILATNVVMHYFTNDNTELIRVALYKSWDDIQKAGERNSELEKEAWPDENARKAYFKNADEYFTPQHSDEIYVTMPGAKDHSEPLKKGDLFYVRTSHFAFPENGSNAEFMALHNEYVANVFHKNKYIKGYYPHAHAWGSDRTAFVEAFLVSSLADLEKALDENTTLFNAHWKDEAARKAFGDKSGKYFTGVHGDKIFSSVPEISKPFTEPVGTN